MAAARCMDRFVGCLAALIYMNVLADFSLGLQRPFIAHSWYIWLSCMLFRVLATLSLPRRYFGKLVNSESENVAKHMCRSGGVGYNSSHRAQH